MSYRAEAYVVRNNLRAYIDVMLRHVQDWSAIQGSGELGNLPPSALSSRTPTRFQKRRVRALLDAWNGYIDDGYLDWEMIGRFNNRFSSVESVQQVNGSTPLLGTSYVERIRRQRVELAYQVMRQDRPAGAIQSLGTVLSSNQLLNHVRGNVTDDYNPFFSALLAWDDNRCYRVYAYLSRFGSLTGEMGGGSTTSVGEQAARRWISSRQRLGIGVYGRWTGSSTQQDRGRAIGG